MNAGTSRAGVLAALLSLGPVLSSASAMATDQVPNPAKAQVGAYEQKVDGLTVRLGLTSARQASMAHGIKRDHAAAPRDRKRQHVLINLSDATSGAYLKAIKVEVEVQDPLHVSQKKKLRAMRHDSITDYGEYFRFDMDGRYSIRAFIWLKEGAAPVEAAFVHNHRLEP